MIARFIPPKKPKLPKGAPARQLVRVSYIPDRLAWLVVEGPQQSELKWKHNGNTIIVCNEFVIKLGEIP